VGELEPLAGAVVGGVVELRQVSDLCWELARLIDRSPVVAARTARKVSSILLERALRKR